MRFVLCLFYIAAAGILSHFIGEALPRSFFHPDRAPYAPFRWEDGGRVYRKIKVHLWKDRLPDMSKISPDMVRKSVSLTGGAEAVARVCVETCVAELVHWVLMLLSFVIYIICPNIWGGIVAVVYGLSHIPFIIIQRYNRPTLLLLARRLREREARLQQQG